MKRAFTLIESVIVISIIAIISAILIPQFTSGYDNTKQEIIDIYNGKQLKIIDYNTKEVIYQGDRDGYKEKYKLIDIEYTNSCVIMYVNTNN